VAALVLFGCAEPGGPTAADFSAVAIVDLATAGRDGAASDLAIGDGPIVPCTLGTPDHCGTCATVCPPGADDVGTKRTCSLPTAFGTCDISCKGEYYDVNGDLADGCEALDEPLQDTTLTAVVVSLPTSQNIVAKVYGDNRTHDTAPTMRPTGREDWYKVNVTGTGDAASGPTACLGITNFPGDNMFEVCLSTKGAASFLQPNCKTATGMMNDMASTSQCVSFANSASEAGTYYVRVRKLSGSWTALSYALFLKH
jgi:hypothetical protein